MTHHPPYDQLKAQHDQLIAAVKVMMAAQAKWDASKNQRDKPALWKAQNEVNKLINPPKVKQEVLDWMAQ